MRILVVGGTGVVGRLLVAELLGRSHSVAVLSRRGSTADPRAEPFAGDAATGAGVAAAVNGVECVIDCAHITTARRSTAVGYFTTSTTLLGQLAHAAGARHHVVLSIVGVDRVPFGYYQGKLAQEQALQNGPLPATVLRATQFHEFAGQNLARFGVGPLALVPAMRCQPVAAAEVANALAQIAEGPALGRAPDIGGPRVEWLPEMARAVVRHTGRRVAVAPLPVPGAAGAMRGGALLLGSDALVRGPAFLPWLETQPR